MTNFTDLQTKRRSIYALGKDVELSNQELIDTIQGAVLNTPTAFNSQTSRVVILLDEESDDFWNEIAYSELEKVTPADAFEGTKERLKGFAQAKGTILFRLHEGIRSVKEKTIQALDLQTLKNTVDGVQNIVLRKVKISKTVFANPTLGLDPHLVP